MDLERNGSQMLQSALQRRPTLLANPHGVEEQPDVITVTEVIRTTPDSLKEGRTAPEGTSQLKKIIDCRITVD